MPDRSNPLTLKTEFTGMVFCPQRISHLAVMACWFNQFKFKCGRRCPNAVKHEEALAIIVKSTGDLKAQLPDPAPEKGIGSFYCETCGYEKKLERSRCCVRCGKQR